MQNILADITAQNWILALFIRDDGERFLLGTGAYEFKKSLQHFQPNTYANDVVELQGTDGQLLAGQVRRTASQPFDGYIADQTINQTETETRRRAFLMFFRKKHFYTVAYILPNGTAIQRRRGYITDAPAVAEMIQRWPEYHVALNFEDPNYYEYAEDEDGNPIYAHEVELAIAGASVGGLVWDEDGVVWDGGIDWRTLQTVQGSFINLDNELDIRAPLSSVELLGNTEQDGTPTPDAPVAVQTTTGEQVVKMCGKNILPLANLTNSGITSAYNQATGELTATGTATANYPRLVAKTPLYLPSGTNYTFSVQETHTYVIHLRLYYNATQYEPRQIDIGSTSTSYTTSHDIIAVEVLYQTGNGTTISDTFKLMLELGSTATDFEPYQSQSYEVNLGKNLFDVSATPWVSKVAYNSSGDKASWSGYYGIEEYQPVQPNTTYRFSNSTNKAIYYGLVYYDASKTKLTFTTASTTTFTTPANCYFIRFAIQNDSAPTWTQLELGSTATDYAAYFTPIELCKLGDYQDKIYKSGDDWFVRKEVRKAKFADMNFNYGQIGSTGHYRQWSYKFQNQIVTPPNNETLGCIASNAYTVLTATETYNRNTGIAVHYGGGIIVYDANYDEASSTAFNTKMAEIDATLYYAIKTPTDTQITNQALIDQLDALASSTLFVGVNNIALVPSGGAQGELKIIYPTDYALTGGAIWSIGGSGGQNIITVDGVDSAFPVWEVVGPATNPTLTNTTTGQSITWNGTVPNGQSLVVDMGEQTATMAGANVFQYIDGQWIRLDAGNNTLTYTATGATAPSILSWNGVVG